MPHKPLVARFERYVSQCYSESQSCHVRWGRPMPTLGSLHHSATSLRAAELRGAETHSPLSSSMTSSPMARPALVRPNSAGVTGQYDSLAPVLISMSAELSRLELRMEEAMARQRIENMQAAMANHRLETASVSDVGIAN